MANKIGTWGKVRPDVDIDGDSFSYPPSVSYRLSETDYVIIKPSTTQEQLERFKIEHGYQDSSKASKRKNATKSKHANKKSDESVDHSSTGSE